LGTGEMAAQVGTDSDGNAGGWFETKMRIETGDPIDLEEWYLKALSELVQRLPRQIAVLVLKVLQFLDQHCVLVAFLPGVGLRLEADHSPLCSTPAWSRIYSSLPEM
jgi:hypothetical protein